MKSLNTLAKTVHEANHKWWHDPVTGQPIIRNRGEAIALIHSEIDEADDAEFTGEMDDKLPHRRGAEVECADAVIRLLDYAGGLGYNLSEVEIERLTECEPLPEQDEETLFARGFGYIHSQTSRLLEMERKDAPHDHKAFQIEIVIRLICLYSAQAGYDIQGAYEEKMAYNATRADHSHEARAAKGGKRF